KVRDREGAIASTRGACAPQITLSRSPRPKYFVRNRVPRDFFLEVFGVRCVRASLSETRLCRPAPLAGAELDSLCQSKLGGEIDRFRLPPHVFLPAIAAALAAAAGLFLATERAADLCPACAGVYVGNSAIAPHCAHEFFRFTHVIGENR